MLFGRPTETTGLSDALCRPKCTCGGELWEAPLYTDADADKLLEWTLESPPGELTSDPYAGDPPGPSGPDEVCALNVNTPGSKLYSLKTFASEGAAKEAGATPTHFGACGLCSSLANLAVYMRYPDLTTPVRACGLKYVAGPKDAHIQCLRDLGFELPCAQIWYYNTLNTASVCSGPCFATINEPYHTPDGALNECLQCDEEKSGPVFKAVAGRTRRNTGVASALCRPCSEVRRLVHKYE